MYSYRLEFNFNHRKENAYNLLKRFQLKGVSFSQTITRLIKRQENILNLAGAWKNIPDSEEAIKLIEKTIKKAREDNNQQIQLIS